MVRVEGDFNSPSAFNYSTEATTNGTNFRIRHAYGEYAGFLVGQTWANFMDLGSLPDTVDFNPHGAFALTRQPGVKYTPTSAGRPSRWRLENPQSVVVNSEVSNSYTVGREYDRYPDISVTSRAALLRPPERALRGPGVPGSHRRRRGRREAGAGAPASPAA